MPRRAQRHRVASAVLLLLALPAIADALDPDKRITQYVIDTWQTRDGLPINQIYSIAQTPDGYVWLSTTEGLVRFDGVRFTVFGRTDRRSPSTFANQLLVDSQGRLWLATDHGLAQWRGGVVHVFTTREGLLDNHVRCSTKIGSACCGSARLGD